MLVVLSTVAGTVVVASAQSAYSLLLSASSNRSSPVPLEGATVTGDIFVFVDPSSGIKRVDFFVDDPTMFGAPFKSDSKAPFDLAGGSARNATAFDTTQLQDGPHSVTASIDLTAGATEIVTSSFTVDNGSPPPPPPSGHTLLVSTSANRSSPVALEGQTVMDSIYVFVDPQTGISRVRFFVDDPSMAGAPFGTDMSAPWDLVGTTKNGNAKPFDTTQLQDGSHNITAAVDLSAGGTEVLTSAFATSNFGPALTLTPASLSFSVASGATASQTLNVGTTGGTASFAVSDDAPWLSVAPASGSSPASLTVSVDSAGLSDGTYAATITATATGFAPAQASVSLQVGEGPGCSPLPCEEILVELPYELDFASDHGKIPDGVGVGTGFTYVMPTSNGTGYLPGKLSMATGTGQLAVDTTSGLMTEAANSQDNALGVGIDAPSQETLMQTTLVNPPAGTGSSEQAGLWFGMDEDNYVKLTVLSTSNGTRVQHFVEVDGRRVAKQEAGPFVLSTTRVRLELRLSPTNETAAATYAVGDGASQGLGTFSIPPEFFSFDAAGIDPRIGTRSFGGIFTSHRHGPAPLTYTFEDFKVSAAGGGSSSQAGVAFDRSSFSVTMPTSMAWGPDGRLYVTEAFGKIHAFTLDANHQPVADQVITTIGSRLTLGITVDPLSTPSNVILWVSHSSPSFNDGEPNSSVVTRLSGAGFTDRADVITGLPRARANHAVNSIHFGPDDKLYIAQGGNTGAGAPNTGNSEFGTMEEQPLSAALLVADVRNPSFDGSCHNASDIFGPPPCDVVPYATGLRNSYDFVFHTNGSIYAPDNGLGVLGTFPPSPTPPCLGFGDTTSWTQGGDNPGQQPDILLRIQQGKYYGHPNPYRDECVFKDGSFQGVSAPANYESPIFVLGDHRSSDGTMEYLSSESFCGSLEGEILITNFSVGDDITRIRLSPDGTSVVSSGSLAGGFNDPLPLAQDPAGTIFVGEFGGNKVTALEPKNLGCWNTRQPLPVQLLDAGGTALGGKLYVVGGKTQSGPQSTTYVYDPQTDSWTTAAALPGAAVENPAVVTLNGKLYAFGGSTAPFSGAVANAAVFDATLGSWTPLPAMPTARGGATAQAINGKIYVAGGMAANGASVDTVEVYDPQANTWATAAPMSTRRDNPGSAVIGGQLYVFGGRTRNADGSAVATLSSVEMYDPSTNTWVARAPMPTGRRTMVVGTVGGRAQVMGGEVQGGNGVSSANEEYDPVTDSWTVLTPMKTPRHGAAAGTIAGIVFVVSGGPAGGGTFSEVNEAFAF